MGGRRALRRAGECLDNAMVERFVDTRKAEFVDRRHRATHAADRTEVFAWVEVFYNHQRDHAAPDYRPAALFEEVVRLSYPVAYRYSVRASKASSADPTSQIVGTARRWPLEEE